MVSHHLISHHYHIINHNLLEEQHIMNYEDYFYYSLQYNALYREFKKYSDEELINQWKYNQKCLLDTDPRYKDVLLIGISVCEDILRQRGNTYLDDLFPKD